MTIRRPLKVLVLGNFSAAPCGIRNFADMTVGGLSAYGFDVTPWDVTYPLVYARREACQPTYLPDDWARYDVIHLNWHPIALNTYGAGHFPWEKGTGPLVSVYLNDVPPWSGCPVAERADLLIAPEAFEGGPDLELVYPIPDWVTDLPPAAERFTVGWSGVRGDGHEALVAVCERRGWAMNRRLPGEPWTPVEDEIRRLARSTVNVCWYHQQRGVAGTPSIMLGSRRPLLLNDSQMFRPWWDGSYDGLYLASDGCRDDKPLTLEAALLTVHEDWQRGQLVAPTDDPTIYTDHSWATAAGRLDTAWRAALEAR